jgi:hypothetical protein
LGTNKGFEVNCIKIDGIPIMGCHFFYEAGEGSVPHRSTEPSPASYRILPYVFLYGRRLPMYYNTFHYPMAPPSPVYPAYTVYPYIPTRSYPPVDTKIFESSVKSFRLLMAQGSILLDRLGDVSFARRIMSAAQQGNNAEVDRLIKSIGLKIPVATQFTPSGVIFELTTKTTQAQPVNCCTLAINMKWGQ